jgi:recombination associated protein RdgC
LSALRGSLTFSRFFVAGDVPGDLAGETLKRIRASASQPLVAEEDQNERHGWCSIEDVMDTDLDHEKVFFNEYVCLGLRIDKWVVPKPLLNAHLRDAEEAVLKQKGMERLGKKAKADLKLFVVKRLRKQLLPSTKSVDLVWNVQSGVARFFSQSEKIHLLVQELFEKTFRLQLVPESPGTAAERRGLDAKAQKFWEAAEATSLLRADDEEGGEA